MIILSKFIVNFCKNNTNVLYTFIKPCITIKIGILNFIHTTYTANKRRLRYERTRITRKSCYSS